MSSNLIRLQEFFNPHDKRSLIIDVSAGLSLGALPGIERFRESVFPMMEIVDGIVTSPGQSRTLSNRTREQAAHLVRSDWTNVLRKSDFVLPPDKAHYLQIVNPSQVLDLGASGMVLYFLLGFEEEIEALCMKTTVRNAIEARKVGLPLIIDIHPSGSRIVLKQKAIELGASFALEGGADGIVVPFPGVDSLKLILNLIVELPVWIKPSDYLNAQEEIKQSLEIGASGIWITEEFLTDHELLNFLKSAKTLIHQSNTESNH